MDYIENILNIAKEKNYSGKQLCELLGKNSSYISDWKSGKSKPKADEIMLLAKEFNVSTDYLLGKTEVKKTDEISINDIEYAFFGEIKELSDEDKQSLLDMARILKKRKEEKRNRNGQPD